MAAKKEKNVVWKKEETDAGGGKDGRSVLPHNVMAPPPTRVPLSASATSTHRYLTAGSDDAACFQDSANARATPFVRVRVRHRCDVESELLLDLVPYLEGKVCVG